jgi:hypothetical protein
MNKKPLEKFGPKRSNLSTRLETIRYLNEISSSSLRRQTTVERIADALIADGYTSLDQQAKALDLNRSTAWTVIKTKHKLGRLNVKTTQQILANPETPSAVRAVIEKYLIERSKLLWCSAKSNDAF